MLIPVFLLVQLVTLATLWRISVLFATPLARLALQTQLALAYPVIQAGF